MKSRDQLHLEKAYEKVMHNIFLIEGVSYGPVYHGTSKDFSQFDNNKSNFRGTIYFTDHKPFAREFATNEMGAGDSRNGYIITAKLDIKKPFDPSNQQHRQTLAPYIEKAIKEKYKDSTTGASFVVPPPLNNPKNNKPINTLQDAVEYIFWRIEHLSWRYIESEPIINAIKQQGFDAIMTQERGAKNIAVFDPKKIQIIEKESVSPSKDKTNPPKDDTIKFE